MNGLDDANDMYADGHAIRTEGLAAQDAAEAVERDARRLEHDARNQEAVQQALDEMFARTLLARAAPAEAVTVETESVDLAVEAIADGGDPDAQGPSGTAGEPTPATSASPTPPTGNDDVVEHTPPPPKPAGGRAKSGA